MTFARARGAGAVANRMEKAEKSALALKMRRQGKGLTEIAQAVGVSPRWVQELVRTALKDIVAGDVNELRAVELMRLEHLTNLISSRLERDLEQDDDAVLNLRAVDRLIRLSERRSKLMGMDMPAQLEIEHHHGPTVIEVGDWVAPVDDPEPIQARLASPPEEGVAEQ